MQMSLHHESMADALRDVIQAAGGPKAVGERMFPDMPIDHAASRIRDCLNSDRRDRLHARAGIDDPAHGTPSRLSCRHGLHRP